MPKGVYTRRKRSLAERLSAKVDTNGPIPEHNPELGQCHVWLGALNSGGYGKIASGEPGKTIDVHRAAWELEHGPLPPGVWVLHRCDNPPCVRLSHLFTGDHGDNMTDMKFKGRGGSGRRNSQSKLTQADALAILRNPDGLSGAATALRFGVSRSVVCNIRKGKAWPHLLP